MRAATILATSSPALAAFQKEKHQRTAQRLIEARQKTREVETQRSEAQAQLTAAATRRESTAAHHEARGVVEIEES